MDATTQERLYAKITERETYTYSTPCWQWMGRLNHDGYAMFDVDRKPKRAVRVVYELIVGPIPDGLTLDHLCRNRACVRPLHVEPVTIKTNVLRGDGSSAVRARTTHCPHGHTYEGDNLGLDRQGHRYCKACRLRWYHANAHRRKPAYARLAEADR